MKVIVFGASRGVGREAAEQAAKMGYGVTAFVRDKSTYVPASQGIKVVEGDATNFADVDAALEGQDVVLCTLGAGTRGATSLYSSAAKNLVAAMTARGLSRVVFLSNFGVLGEGSAHPITALLTAIARFSLKGTLADHRRALEALKASDLKWTAVRPMTLTDGPPTRNFRVSETGLPAGGWRIARSDVASFMLDQLRGERYINRAPAVAY